MARLFRADQSRGHSRNGVQNEEESLFLRLSRGLYQLPDAALGTHHDLAEAAKLVPKGVVCLTSALAFHGLTDTIPSRVWMAIGAKDKAPRRNPYLSNRAFRHEGAGFRH
jgi:predicted transcriptional regulator of viral defense system